ncbi:helix-turn-helix domain-containing protein [Pyruvatibacter sp.]|uniref:Crp/Fnr family transcriptional regulator n=1 Tax=Pyruvatibacter sp. TaxID=1981328 RepID=UPI0032EE6058
MIDIALARNLGEQMQDFGVNNGMMDNSTHDALSPALPRDSSSPCVNCDVRMQAICAVLNDDELGALAKLTHSESHDVGETLFFEGDRAGECFIVQKGALKLYKLLPDGRRQITGFLFKGDFLGLSHGEEYIYTAEVLEQVETCSLKSDRMQHLVEQFPKLSNRMLNLATLELSVAQEQMLLLGRKTAQERIATFLLWLSNRAAERGEDANPVRVPMSRSDMGDYLGLTVETVSRSITKLKTSGIITLKEGNRVQINDRELLDAIATGDGH